MAFPLHKILLAVSLVFSSWFCVGAQSMSEDFRSSYEGYKYAFSKEGRKEWKPEFTIRLCMGLPTGGPAVTGGIRINNNHTLGVFIMQETTYIDAVPADIYDCFAGLFWRGYIHLGKRNVISLYSDVSLGGNYVYRVNGKYRYMDGEQIEVVKTSPGDVAFVATWQPGIRLRFWKNIHIFLGPTFSNNIVGGLHFGVGF